MHQYLLVAFLGRYAILGRIFKTPLLTLGAQRLFFRELFRLFTRGSKKSSRNVKRSTATRQPLSFLSTMLFERGWSPVSAANSKCLLFRSILLSVVIILALTLKFKIYNYASQSWKLFNCTILWPMNSRHIVLFIRLFECISSVTFFFIQTMIIRFIDQSQQSTFNAASSSKIQIFSSARISSFGCIGVQSLGAEASRCR